MLSSFKTFLSNFSTGKNKGTSYYPSIEYTIGKKGDVKVVSKVQIGFKEEKDEEVRFSIVLKNELYTTLEKLPEWKSVITLEVPGDPDDRFVKEQLVIPLLEGGFLATRTQQVEQKDRINLEIWERMIAK